jgi:hypothetical protein
MQTKFNWILVACATAALVIVGYREMSSKPVPHVVDQASCTQEAIKSINSITERAIQSANCAQLGK